MEYGQVNNPKKKSW